MDLLKSILMLLAIVAGRMCFEFAVEYWRKPKCPHGIKNGKQQKNGKCKCYRCQFEYEEFLRKQEKERKQQEIIKKREELFKTNIISAIQKRKKALCSNLVALTKITPSAFEDLVANLFRYMGYKVRQTPYTNDGGKDAYIYKEGMTYLVECKKYALNAHVGRPLIQKLYAAMNEEHVTNGIFVTTAQFSKTALEYGKKFNIQTIDGKELMDYLVTCTKKYSLESNYEIPCLQCGEMVSFDLIGEEENKICCNGHKVNNVFFQYNNNTVICLKCGAPMLYRTGHYTNYHCSQCSYSISLRDYQYAIGERVDRY